MGADVTDVQVEETIRRIVREELDQTDPAAHRLLANPAAAEFPGTSVSGLDWLVDEGSLPYVRVRGRRKLAVGDLITYQRKHTTPAVQLAAWINGRLRARLNGLSTVA